MFNSRVCRRSTASGGLGLLLLALSGAPVDVHAEALVWTRTYNGAASGDDYGAAVGIGPDGSVYVAGSTEDGDFDLLLRKYSAEGDFVWIRKFDGNHGLDDDWGRGLAVDPKGNVYVVGDTLDALHSVNLLLRKYSPAGAVLWTRKYRADSDAEGYDVAVAPDGSVYVAGTLYAGPQDYNLLLRKYSAQGNPLWTAFYNGAANGSDEGLGVAVAPDGSVYVTGTTETAGEAMSLVLLKYSAAGSLQWTRTYDGPANAGQSGGTAVAVGSGGNVCVSGTTAGQALDFNALLQKYSASGKPLWTRIYNGNANRWDMGNGVAVGPGGNVYVVGYASIAGQAENLLLRKFSAAGVLLWQTTYNGAANGGDSGLDVAVGPDGSVYVTGATQATGQGYDLLLQKYQ